MKKNLMVVVAVAALSLAGFGCKKETNINNDTAATDT